MNETWFSSNRNRIIIVVAALLLLLIYNVFKREMAKRDAEITKALRENAAQLQDSFWKPTPNAPQTAEAGLADVSPTDAAPNQPNENKKPQSAATQQPRNTNPTPQPARPSVYSQALAQQIEFEKVDHNLKRIDCSKPYNFAFRFYNNSDGYVRIRSVEWLDAPPEGEENPTLEYSTERINPKKFAQNYSSIIVRGRCAKAGVGSRRLKVTIETDPTGQMTSQELSFYYDGYFIERLNQKKMVEFTPKILDFGPLAAGETKTLKFYVKNVYSKNISVSWTGSGEYVKIEKPDVILPQKIETFTVTLTGNGKGRSSFLSLKAKANPEDGYSEVFYINYKAEGVR